MKKLFPIVILIGCTAALAFGIVQLFELRFEAGDVYPPYSSLRADPLGAMALYESLGKIPGLSVRRDFSASDQLPEEPNTVYMHLAGSPHEWDWMPTDLRQEIDVFLARGGRLVITFYPQTAPRIFHDDEDQETNSDETAGSKGEKMTPQKKRKKVIDDDSDFSSLRDEWGIYTDFRKLPQDGDVYAPVSVANQTDLPLPPMLDWHSGIVFTNVAKSWRVIYARDDDAVVIERKFGRGSVVIATDSYFISNEAMTKDRHADLLAWLIGPNRNIVFDEAHLGIVETSGVAMLMRKYRLHGLVAGLVLLAGLFIWKNSTSLVPPREDAKGEDFVAAKDSGSGFVNLLRRSIAPRDLLVTCFAEWKKTVCGKGKIPVTRFQQAEAIFSSENLRSYKDRNPVEAYKKISETLGTQNQKI